MRNQRILSSVIPNLEATDIGGYKYVYFNDTCLVFAALFQHGSRELNYLVYVHYSDSDIFQPTVIPVLPPGQIVSQKFQSFSQIGFTLSFAATVFFSKTTH